MTNWNLPGFEEFRKSYPYLCSVNRETPSNSSCPTEEDHVDSCVDNSNVSPKSPDSSLSLSEGFCGFSKADLPIDIEKKLKSPLIGRRSSKEIMTRKSSRRTPNAWNLPTMEQKEIEEALTRMIDAEKIREHNAKKHKEDEAAKEKSEEGSNVEEEKEKEKDEIMNEVNETKNKKKEKKEKKKKKDEKQKQKKKKEKGEKEKKKQKGKKKVKEGEGNSDHANEDAKDSHGSQVSPENGQDKSKKLKKKKLYKSLLGRNGMAKEKVHQNEAKEESAREEKVQVQGNVSNETEEERGLYIEEETGMF